MTPFVVIGCGKTKRALAPGEQCRAIDLYTGPLFLARLAHARALGGPQDVVAGQAASRAAPGQRIVVLASGPYAAFAAALRHRFKRDVVVLGEGMQIGELLAYHRNEAARLAIEHGEVVAESPAGRETALRTRAPAGLACDARPDPRGPHDQSQERGPRGQPTGEPRARDLLRADEGRYSTGLRPDSEPSISWLIVGGESGPGARPFDLAWARSVVTQCREAGVACFVKQLGASPVDAPRDAGGFVVTQPGGDPWPSRPVRLRHRKGADLSELPAELRVREFPNPKDTTR